MGERILCFQVNGSLIKYRNKNIFYDSILWNNILDNLVIIDRDDAEEDTRYKQLIVYIIIKSGDLYASYLRTPNTGETRLKEKHSIGFGGHISLQDWNQMTISNQILLNLENPQTDILDFTSIHQKSFMLQAMWRELDEEVNIKSILRKDPRLVYFINDDSTDVGKVHFGIVWIVDILNPDLRLKGEKGIGRLEFHPINVLVEHFDNYERWSQFVIRRLAIQQGNGRVQT